MTVKVSSPVVPVAVVAASLVTVNVGVVVVVVVPVVVAVLSEESSLFSRMSAPTSKAAPATPTAMTVGLIPEPPTMVTSSWETEIWLPSMMYWPSFAMKRWPFSSSNSTWPLPMRSNDVTELVMSSKPSTPCASACAAASTATPAAERDAAVILPRLSRLMSAFLLAIRSATDFMSYDSIKFSAPKSVPGCLRPADNVRRAEF